VYAFDPKRKAIIVGQTKDLYFVKSDMRVWKTTLNQNLGCQNIIVIKNGSKNEIITKLKNYVNEGLSGDLLSVYVPELKRNLLSIIMFVGRPSV
jgi:hypothetical protein